MEHMCLLKLDFHLPPLQDCALHRSCDVLDKHCVLEGRLGSASTQIKITSTRQDTSWWYSDVSSRLKGHAFTITLPDGGSFAGEAYVRMVPILLGDTPCCIWVTCAALWTYIFSADYDSEMIGKAGQFIPNALGKLGLHGAHFRCSKKSLSARAQASKSPPAGDVWASSEQQFSFSIKGLVAWLLIVVSSTGHWKLTDEERQRALQLGKGLIDTCLKDKVCFSVGSTVVLVENGSVDGVVLYESQRDLHHSTRLLSD
jgi:hypothetical protein